MSINVRQPAIVLMNPENAGSLLATPTTVGAQKWAEYWRKRATVYVMGTCHRRRFVSVGILEHIYSRCRRILLSTTRERWSKQQQFNELIDEYS